MRGSRGAGGAGASERERLSEIRNSRREPSDKAERFQRALRYRNLLDGRPGRPIHSGNLCFVSPADRTAGEFDLTTTCPETPRIRVHVSRCALPIYRVRPNFGNAGGREVDARARRPPTRRFADEYTWPVVSCRKKDKRDSHFGSITRSAPCLPIISTRSPVGIADTVRPGRFRSASPGTPFWCIAPDKGQVCICTACLVYPPWKCNVI